MTRATSISTRGRLVTLTCVLPALVATLGAQTASWLDRPLDGWNTPAMAVPPAPPRAAGLDAALKTCATPVPAPSPAVSAVARAGWTPFLHQDRALTRDDVEIVAGLTSLTSICEADRFNLFVFTGGRFAGTLSPAPMHANRDGVAGAVRIAGAETITAEFGRYAAGDSECCPTSRVRVTYALTRGPNPAVHPTSLDIRR